MDLTEEFDAWNLFRDYQYGEMFNVLLAKDKRTSAVEYIQTKSSFQLKRVTN